MNRFKCLASWGYAVLMTAVCVYLLLSPKSWRPTQAFAPPRSTSKALDIALAVMETNKLMYKPDYRIVVARDEDSWRFWFQFLPESFGNDVTVFVFDNGKTQFLPGF